VGALIDLLADDCVAPGPSDLNARFIRGTPLKAIFGQFNSPHKRNGFAAPGRRQAVPQTMIAPAFPLDAQLHLATGVAWSLKRHAKPSVAVAFYNDEPGSCLDAIRFSAAHKLPIVHIVHNSGLALSSSLAKHATSAQQPILPAFRVDGNDVVAVYRVAQEAIRRARQGHGPALIECQACNWDVKPETDSPETNTKDRQPALSSVDPILRMQAYLERKRLWSSAWKQKLVERFSSQLNRAV
jgi:TPP-dependent pyruvate/acetoin dehydrogenase alpha subunit